MQTLETLKLKKNSVNKSKKQSERTARSHHVQKRDYSRQCLMSKKNHMLMICDEYKTSQEQRQYVEDQQLCVNCLGKQIK